ncbi:Gfo/Idh/MocA family oxidoreductase [Amycolatopsis acidiphila]|uniref:Gfo/Idh/MocA family oxidoreductase n=1 Tax=Amycolatopsis acidiphila TaxID=715473 RepID=A0A558A6B4_9PSEU|nr:Gfo/Idh/MocA family oxidoreductase [Amycolatopsis acidiphila]TVT19758.1 Gfo/Idh/MocA family oxidoreductase [Amycolatopsis acidiphila]UIJ61879.1 Gfo/Idh/MocA family oxidoreductase [Amycolatopsis acidiphila]GHG57401.1 oxidoreductase [Amycolatopsis acidiphila]
MVLRVGVLGAASVVPMALLRPAAAEPDVVVTAIAARDRERARRFAERHGIPEVHQDYAALLADPRIDAVYNPLPNGLHGRWTIAALEAGKHVLCEKPFTANAQEAEAVAAVARRTGLVAMEAFHYRYHALTARMLELRAELGPVRRIDTWFAFPLLPAKNIRWNLGLAGGATMDVGCYAMHLLRTLAGAEPRITSATAKLRYPGVDRSMRAEATFDDGMTGSIDVSMLSHRIFTAGARVVGERGAMRVFNPYAPQAFHRLTIRTGGRRRVEHVDRKPSSYAAQLHAFAGAVLHGEPVVTGIDDAVANMRALDACYGAAGLQRREPTI